MASDIVGPYSYVFICWRYKPFLTPVALLIKLKLVFFVVNINVIEVGDGHWNYEAIIISLRYFIDYRKLYYESRQ